MSAVYTLPSGAEVAELMHGLFGSAVTSVTPPEASVHSIAEYVNDSGSVVGYIGCDLAGGCRLGAALTMVPAGRVDEAVKERQVPDTLSENLDEIFNICVNLIASPDCGRVVLKRVLHGESSSDFAAAESGLSAAADTVTVGIDIPRYGVCRMVIARSC